MQKKYPRKFAEITQRIVCSFAMGLSYKIKELASRSYGESASHKSCLTPAIDLAQTSCYRFLQGSLKGEVSVRLTYSSLLVRNQQLVRTRSSTVLVLPSSDFPGFCHSTWRHQVSFPKENFGTREVGANPGPGPIRKTCQSIETEFDNGR